MNTSETESNVYNEMKESSESEIDEVSNQKRNNESRTEVKIYTPVYTSLQMQTKSKGKQSARATKGRQNKESDKQLKGNGLPRKERKEAWTERREKEMKKTPNNMKPLMHSSRKNRNKKGTK